MDQNVGYDRRYAYRRDDLVSTWTGTDLLDGSPCRSFTVIFRTKGCSWSEEDGCLMCGYHTASNPLIEYGKLGEQLKVALSKYNGEKIVKIYTSGSFLHDHEIPLDTGRNILESFDAEKVIIESRPEYVDGSVLETYSSLAGKLEVAMGLESTNDFILRNCINKGFTYDDYRRAADTIISSGCDLRTYLLFKPPFLTESEAIDDLTESISKVSSGCNTVSINPMNVQKDTLVEKLWYRKEYRPPWIWSLFRSVIDAEFHGDIVISRAGVGSRRGAHNCGDCDELLIDNLDEFNLTQDKTILEDSFDLCQCTERWRSHLVAGALLNHRGSLDILCDRYAGYI